MDITPGPLMFVVSIVLIISFIFVMLVMQYKRCPSNRVLVVYEKVTSARAARCIHGGGTFVVPLLQSYAYMTLEPVTIDIELQSALSKKNIRVNVPSTFTTGISTVPEIMNDAAERLLGLDDVAIAHQARDIVLGQMRLVIATLSIERINQDRENFLDLVNKNVNYELNKIGLEMINVNIRDITDESGYIEVLGRKAASEVVNQSQSGVRSRKPGESRNGGGQSRRFDRLGDSAARNGCGSCTTELTVCHRSEAHQRVEIAELEAAVIEGENESKAKMADYNAALAEREADARRRGDVALANSKRDVLLAQKEEEIA